MRLADPASYTSSNGDQLRQMAQDDAYLSREIAKLEEEWLEQQSAIEQIGVMS